MTPESVLAGGTVTVSGTAERIASGKPRMACQCPVALAIADALPGAEWAMVRYSDEPEHAMAWVRGPWGFSRLILGEGGAAIMRRADAGEEIEPFTLVAQVAEGGPVAGGEVAA